MPAELPVDEQRQAEPDQHLEQDRPEDEMRRRLHRCPDVGIGQDVDVVVDADGSVLHPPHVRLVVRERHVDGPQQREDVDREQQHDRWRDEEPRDRAIGHPAEAERERGCGGRQGNRGCLGDFDAGRHDWPLPLKHPSAAPAYALARPSVS